LPVAHEQAPAVEVQPPEPVAEEEPFDPAKYIPRSTAPELASNLAAMRELANSSARGAIDTSKKRRQTRSAGNKLLMSMLAFASAVSLGWLSMRTHSAISYYAALSAGAAAFLWSLHAGYLWLKARRQERMRKQEVTP
jgi:hypothetical protein